MAKYGGTPQFFTQKFFFQNDSGWLEMDFKHNFIKCYIFFFLKASLTGFMMLQCSKDKVKTTDCPHLE